MDYNLLGKPAAILKSVRDRAHKIPINNNQFVIFSDLHMGSGARGDDFLKNGAMFEQLLSDYYLPGNYHLILNGDVEELQKFTWKQIQRRWKPLYDIFDRFLEKGMFYKTLGNHDLILSNRHMEYPYDVHESLELYQGRRSLLIYHGHQFSEILQHFETLFNFALRFLAAPLGIMNYSKSPDNRKKYKTELRAYEASRELGVISVIGHTHRPLFEALSKKDSLKYLVDSLIRDYSEAGQLERAHIKAELHRHQQEIVKMNKGGEFHISELYSVDGLIPCLFNSGCVIGKRGITALEIQGDEIQLAYWCDEQEISSAQIPVGYSQHSLPGTTLRKVILNKERLDYINDRIDLMSWKPEGKISAAEPDPVFSPEMIPLSINDIDYHAP